MDYLLTLEHFRDLMVRQMETTAAEELEAKINMRKLEASNEKLIAKIKGNISNIFKKSLTRTRASKSYT